MFDDPKNYDETITLKFEDFHRMDDGKVQRIIGFVKGKYLIDLIGISSLDANPRSAKVSRITDDIIDSIVKTKELFPFKTKGILLGISTPPKDLERKRFQLTIKNDDTFKEGILDGGHNTLAMAIHILAEASKGKPIKKIKNWQDLQDIWHDMRSEIDDIRSSLNFLMPVEILAPANDDEQVIDDFRVGLLDICAARNNNLQLTSDTKANAAGHYDEIKKIVDNNLRGEIIWKDNEVGRIKVREIIALAWVGLLALNSDVIKKHKISPVQIYSSKGKCVENFIALMEDENVSKQTRDGTYELKNSGVHNALKLLRDLPRLYDLIHESFADAYNSTGGKFGRISVIKSQKGKNCKTIFYKKAVDHKAQEGWIAPLFYGLSALIETNEEGKVSWKVPPDKFLKDNLSKIMGQYKTFMDAFGFDPQKVGKNSGSYPFAKQQFEYYLDRSH